MSTEVRVNATYSNGEQLSVRLDGWPEECPICHRGQKPQYLNYAFLGTLEKDGLKRLQTTFRCSYSDCEKLFITLYAFDTRDNRAYFFKSLPEKFVAKKWEKTIEDLSQNFVEIYSQASEAESKGLDKIAGPGYRKALEYLIKDWLIVKNLDNKETITSMPLGQCIKNYIDEQVIQDVAARAAWLGNDETHYTRVWTEKDINDLKRLIDLTASWVDMRKLSEKAIEEMPKPVKKTNKS